MNVQILQTSLTMNSKDKTLMNFLTKEICNSNNINQDPFLEPILNNYPNKVVLKKKTLNFCIIEICPLLKKLLVKLLLINRFLEMKIV